MSFLNVISSDQVRTICNIGKYRLYLEVSGTEIKPRADQRWTFPTSPLSSCVSQRVLHSSVPFTVFCLSGLSAGCLGLMLPETLNGATAETLDELTGPTGSRVLENKVRQLCWYQSQYLIRTGSGTGFFCGAITEISILIFHSWNSDEKLLNFCLDNWNFQMWRLRDVCAVLWPHYVSTAQIYL